MEAFNKFALQALSAAGLLAALSTAASAQLPVGYCLNMPSTGLDSDIGAGCETGEPDPNPRDVGNYGNGASTGQATSAELANDTAEPQS